MSRNTIPNLAESHWVGTQDVGRALHLSDEGVRYLVREGQLACVRKPSRHRMFLAAQVLDLAAKRAQAQLVLLPPSPPPARRRPSGPQQMPLFHVHHTVVKAKPALEISQAKDQRSRGVSFRVR